MVDESVMRTMNGNDESCSVHLTVYTNSIVLHFGLRSVTVRVEHSDLEGRAGNVGGGS